MTAASMIRIINIMTTFSIFPIRQFLALIINGLDSAGFNNSFPKRLLFSNRYHCKGNGPAFNGFVLLQEPFENKRKPVE